MLNHTRLYPIMMHDLTLHICHCILPYFSIIWCEDLFSLYNTCKTIREYLISYYGKFIILPNNVPYCVRSNASIRISMTNTKKCIIEEHNKELLIISQHTRGYVAKHSVIRYNIEDKYLHEYTSIGLIRKYTLVIIRELIDQDYPYNIVIHEYIPKKIIELQHRTETMRFSPCLDHSSR